jgi:hypothetical protein
MSASAAPLRGRVIGSGISKDCVKPAYRRDIATADGQLRADGGTFSARANLKVRVD